MSKLNFIYLCLLVSCVIAFQSDELLQDDEEFGLEGGLPHPVHLDLDSTNNIKIPIITPPVIPSIRKSVDDSDSKIQFTLEHAFGDSDFVPTGTFTARLKSWSHGGQTLTKLRFSRNTFTDSEKEEFKQLLKDDEFYRIRLPSNVLSPPGKDYIVSSVKARCLPRDGLDEHFVIHMESVNILAVNYGSPGACPYPRPFKLPTKWSFNSHTVLRNSEQAPRAPAFVEDIIIGGEKNAEGENVPAVEKTFWAKYWMYLIPLVLIVMNAVTQAMNMPEEPAAGGAQVAQRAAPAANRRR
ncbi:hypothetical protein MKW94_020123 [Papaver nudicaule]|uniref:ER membrane protein complex subunit 10 n=1 Tax=Papaver nudicaule TaxID=74823 RepID=A0AA41UWE7_PAPNU|nr:hypothetical protein [Papaver nudicaule]